jgi:hypothetical protein
LNKPAKPHFTKHFFMKRILIALAIAPALLGLTPAERTVYICDSKNAVAYHLVRDCRGIANCKSTIVSVTESTAKGKDLHLCGWED